MTERIITDSNGRKHITKEPQLHPPQHSAIARSSSATPRTWVSLDDDDINNVLDSLNLLSPYVVACAIEAKLKEKNA